MLSTAVCSIYAHRCTHTLPMFDWTYRMIHFNNLVKQTDKVSGVKRVMQRTHLKQETTKSLGGGKISVKSREHWSNITSLCKYEMLNALCLVESHLS